MGFLDGGSSKPKVKRHTLWDRGQEDLAKNYLYPGLRQGPFTPTPAQDSLWRTSLTGLEQYAQGLIAGMPEMMQQGQELRGAGAQTLIDAMTRGPQDIDEYYTQTVMNPMMEMFQEDILPGISRNYAPSGFYSSQRLNADQRAQEELLSSLTQGRASMAYNARESDLNRALQAAGMGMGQQSADMQALLGFLGGAGSFASGTMSPDEASTNRYRNTLLDALRLNPFENIIMNPGGGDTWGSFLGGLGQLGMGIYGFSKM